MSGCGQQKDERKIISTPDAPAAIGPYSQAVLVGNTVYVSGQIGIDPETNRLGASIEEQTHRTIRNIESILIEAGSALEDVVQCQVFLADLNHYQTVNDIYLTYFGESLPSRAVVEVSRIPRDALIEILVIAVKK